MLASAFKVDREDHFQRPGFLHIMCFPRVLSLSLKKLDVTDVLKSQNLKSLNVNLVLSLVKQCSRVQNFCFFVERILMDSSHILWNKFQVYQLRFILTNHILVTA